MYQAYWEQSDASGQLTPSVDRFRAVDLAELAEAINRRRLMVFLDQEDFSSQISAGLDVRTSVLDVQSPPPFTNLRHSVEATLVDATPGQAGGDPATPSAISWLWPVADADENKVIVNGFSGLQQGQVSLFDKLNGGDDWTDPALEPGQTAARAVHVDELRGALEYLRRGQWILPFYGSAGITSEIPDECGSPQLVANNDYGETRCVGDLVLLIGESPPRGLTNVTVRSSSCLRITAEADCVMQVYRCKRSIDFASDPPTWSQYAPLLGSDWQSAGGLGTDDAELIGSVSCVQDTPAVLSGDAVASALQSMIALQPQNLIFRRSDTAAGTVVFAAEAVVEFDLNSPPN